MVSRFSRANATCPLPLRHWRASRCRCRRRLASWPPPRYRATVRRSCILRTKARSRLSACSCGASTRRPNRAPRHGRGRRPLLARRPIDRLLGRHQVEADTSRFHCALRSSSVRSSRSSVALGPRMERSCSVRPACGLRQVAAAGGAPQLLAAVDAARARSIITRRRCFRRPARCSSPYPRRRATIPHRRSDLVNRSAPDGDRQRVRCSLCVDRPSGLRCR